MKKISNSVKIALIAAMCLVIAALLFIPGRDRKPKDGECTITVCATTDIHGAYFSQSYTEGEANATSMSNVSSFLKEFRSQGNDPVLIDVGDALQGDNAAYYYNYVNTGSEHVFASIAKYLKYDALIVGNHDIEAGPDVYNMMKAKFPKSYLAANAVHSSGSKMGRSYFAQYAVVKRNGFKIAIIGMTNANIKNWLPEEKWEGLDFITISEMVQNIVTGVRAEVQPDIVILAMHSGMGNSFPALENEAKFVASDVKGVDLVVCGHDHKAGSEPVLTIDGNTVPVLDAGTKADHIGLAELKLNVTDGKVTSITKKCRVISMKDYAPDAAYDKKFEKQYKEVNAYANKAIGQLEGDLNFEDGVNGPSAYISFVQKVQMDASGADISFAAPLTVKGKVGKGVIAVKDLADIYRFENQLYTVKMTGEQIKNYLEFSYEHWVNNQGPAFNFDSAEGIIYEVKKSADKGSRVNIISMTDGTPFDPEKTYTVAMTSYRASGGGYLLLNGAGISPSNLEIVKKGDDIRGLIEAYIREHRTITPAVSDNWKWVE